MTSPDSSPLPMGSTIGILGGGQLGRMLSLAAARLGAKTHIYCPDPASPAFDSGSAAKVMPRIAGHISAPPTPMPIGLSRIWTAAPAC